MRARHRFNRALLPSSDNYYEREGLMLKGGSEWKVALCPFHHDTQPSLQVRSESGGFWCAACGARGGDVLAFHRLKYGMGFIEAAKALGAWEYDQ